MADKYCTIVFMNTLDFAAEVAECPADSIIKIEPLKENGRDKIALVTFGSDAAEISAFSFAEQTGAATIDSEAATVDIEVAFATDPTDLVATFTLSDLARGAKVDGEYVTSASTELDYTDPVVFEVISENGTRKEWTVTVTIAAE